MVAVVACAFAAAIAAVDIEPKKDPPGSGTCTCPLNYDPVVCRAADGTLHTFSNACFAGCAGFTRCSSISPEQW
jgi:hypothetical protein